MLYLDASTSENNTFFNLRNFFYFLGSFILGGLLIGGIGALLVFYEVLHFSLSLLAVAGIFGGAGAVGVSSIVCIVRACWYQGGDTIEYHSVSANDDDEGFQPWTQPDARIDNSSSDPSAPNFKPNNPLELYNLSTISTTSASPSNESETSSVEDEQGAISSDPSAPLPSGFNSLPLHVDVEQNEKPPIDRTSTITRSSFTAHSPGVHTHELHEEGVAQLSSKRKIVGDSDSDSEDEHQVTKPKGGLHNSLFDADSSTSSATQSSSTPSSTSKSTNKGFSFTLDASPVDLQRVHSSKYAHKSTRNLNSADTWSDDEEEVSNVPHTIYAHKSTNTLPRPASTSTSSTNVVAQDSTRVEVVVPKINLKERSAVFLIPPPSTSASSSATVSTSSNVITGTTSVSQMMTAFSTPSSSSTSGSSLADSTNKSKRNKLDPALLANAKTMVAGPMGSTSTPGTGSAPRALPGNQKSGIPRRLPKGAEAGLEKLFGGARVSTASVSSDSVDVSPPVDLPPVVDNFSGSTNSSIVPDAPSAPEAPSAPPAPPLFVPVPSSGSTRKKAGIAVAVDGDHSSAPTSHKNVKKEEKGAAGSQSAGNPPDMMAEMRKLQAQRQEKQKATPAGAQSSTPPTRGLQKEPIVIGKPSLTTHTSTRTASGSSSNVVPNAKAGQLFNPQPPAKKGSSKSIVVAPQQQLDPKLQKVFDKRKQASEATSSTFKK